MTLQQLKYVIVLDQERHFAHAAEKCSVSQPGLTTQLKKLEEEIGLLIFDRSKVPLKPTSAGKEIIAMAKKVLFDVDNIREYVVSQKNTMSGTITIGTVVTLSPYLIPICLGHMKKAAPEINFVIKESSTLDLMNDLEIGEIDVALMSTPTGNPYLKEYPLFDEPFMAYLPPLHRQAARSRFMINPKNIETLMILEEEYCYNSQLLDICDLKKIDSMGKHTYAISTIETLKNMVKAHHGFAILPWLSVKGESTHGDVACLPFEDPQPVREISLVTAHSFTKKVLLEKLSKAIWDSLPKDLKNTKNYRKVRWNDSPYWQKAVADLSSL